MDGELAARTSGEFGEALFSGFGAGHHGFGLDEEEATGVGQFDAKTGHFDYHANGREGISWRVQLKC